MTRVRRAWFLAVVESMPSAAIVDLRNVAKTYTRGNQVIPVLQDVTLSVSSGAFVALMGPSGSGKSTLLNLIAGLDRPSQGRVTVAGSELSILSEHALTRFRGRFIGFVFQSDHLMPALTALQNVQLPLFQLKLSSAERRRRATTALEIVGLADRLAHHPSQLSGGQAQRVAVARAIVHDPKIIVADEPTGSLDRTSAHAILELLAKLHRDFGKTIVMVTHDPVAAERADTVRRLDKGVLRS